MAFYSRYTGEEISEGAHILQSIQIILTTRIGSRVMRRDFGSKLPGLVDVSLTPENLTAIYAAANEAISRWEPRVQVVSTRIDPADAEQGIVKLRVVVRGPNGLLSEQIVIPRPDPSTPTGAPETPLDPSTPTGAPETPIGPSGDSQFTTFLIGDNAILLGDTIAGIDI